MLSNKQMGEAKALVSTAASIAASAILIRSIANDLVPWQVQNFLSSFVESLSRRFSSKLTIVIEEFQGFSTNQVFEDVEIYLGFISSPSVQRIRVAKSENQKDLAVRIDRNEEVLDVFENEHFKWRLITTKALQPSAENYQRIGNLNSSVRSEVRSFLLTFHKKHREKAFKAYLPYILERAKAIREEKKAIKLYRLVPHRLLFREVNLNHPMNFNTLALDFKLKKELLEDLDNFINGKEYYKRIGRAWKRGYLLYGPPGTGKTSLIAAMANHLNFDIYDLDLSTVRSNRELRQLLLGMSSRSILVMEDIDCSINLQNRDLEEHQSQYNNTSKVTLSGLLNFIDGLWSCLGEGRIIVLTTNYKERLDPALLRPGRMDVHVLMSYCNTYVFPQLAFNYLGICHHNLFDEIERLIQDKIEVTPAEVAGELVKSADAEVSLQGLLNFLKSKKKL